jgi:hypothetical protein
MVAMCGSPYSGGGGDARLIAVSVSVSPGNGDMAVISPDGGDTAVVDSHTTVMAAMCGSPYSGGGGDARLIAVSVSVSPGGGDTVVVDSHTTVMVAMCGSPYSCGGGDARLIAVPVSVSPDGSDMAVISQDGGDTAIVDSHTTVMAAMCGSPYSRGGGDARLIAVLASVSPDGGDTAVISPGGGDTAVVDSHTTVMAAMCGSTPSGGNMALVCSKK